MRTIGSARTALTTAAGMSRNAIWRSPVLTVARNPSMSPRVANRDSDGKRTVAIATENTPCGSMYTRNAFWIAVGA